jgi:hypothetical protein
MSMQPRAWMTSYLFSAWISPFIGCVQSMGNISIENRHLLILDGHCSHITLDVVQEARVVGLDLLTLPSHTSHVLQLLDVSVFKPFKTFFKEYRDLWTSQNLNQVVTKQTLAHWVSLGLRRALTPDNIHSGLRTTGIFSFYQEALNQLFSPHSAYEQTSQGVQLATIERHDEGSMGGPAHGHGHAGMGGGGGSTGIGACVLGPWGGHHRGTMSPSKCRCSWNSRDWTMRRGPKREYRAYLVSVELTCSQILTAS